MRNKGDLDLRPLHFPSGIVLSLTGLLLSELFCGDQTVVILSFLTDAQHMGIILFKCHERMTVPIDGTSLPIYY